MQQLSGARWTMPCPGAQLGFDLPVAQCPSHGRFEMLDRERLSEDREAEPAAVPIEVGPGSGEHDDADLRVAVPHVFHELQARAAGHRVVGQHEVVALLLEESQALRPARGEVRLTTPNREQLAQETTDVWLVIDD